MPKELSQTPKAQYCREWYQANAESQREAKRQWRAANPGADKRGSRNTTPVLKAKAVAAVLRSRTKHREKYNSYQHGYSLKALYGLSVEQYAAMLSAQNGKCAICHGNTRYRLAVDHCHQSGRVRGLLCSRCNVGLGQFKEDPQLLYEAMDYLRKASN